jgi:hypothetical protein
MKTAKGWGYKTRARDNRKVLITHYKWKIADFLKRWLISWLGLVILMIDLAVNLITLGLLPVIWPKLPGWRVANGR